MTIIFNGEGTIQGLASGGIPDATITNAEIVSLDSTKLTGNIQQAQLATPLNATGTAPLYAARAWVNFNGTGTVAIRAAGNVSSITDNGTGDYTVNFSTAMPNTNYATLTNIAEDYVNNTGGSVYGTRARFAPTTTSVRVKGVYNTGSNVYGFDVGEYNVAVFG